jgi:hypothetical protein
MAGLPHSTYVSLTTFRRTGVPVAAPSGGSARAREG